METEWNELADVSGTVSEPTVEQFIFYLRLVEGDDQEWRAARRRAFEMDLNSLAAHLAKWSGRPFRWNANPQESSDPYVSQCLATTGWVSTPNGRRACFAEARTYGDTYRLHIRYYRRGTWPATVYATMRREDVWTPWQEEQLLGQSFFLAGMANLEEGHALAAQILRQQMPPGQGIGELQTCGLEQSRVYRGSTRADTSVFLYSREGAEQAIGSFLDHWAARWEFHRQKLDHELSWCEGISTWLEEQATRLREAIRGGDLQNDLEKWSELYTSYEARLATCLRRENAVQSDLDSLEWLLNRLETEGPDTYFAAFLRPLRARRQQLAASLVNWQRTRDEVARAIAAVVPLTQSLPMPLRGDLSRIWLNSQQPTPVLADLAAAQQMPAWWGRGWVPAEAIHFPDDSRAFPRWTSRRYDKLSFLITGPRQGDGYRLQVTSSVLGECQGILRLPVDAPQMRGFLTPAPDAQNRGTNMTALGDALFQALLETEREEIYRQALALARATGRGLCCRLSIAQAPELEALPWEYLHDKREDIFLAASAETPFARCLSEADAAHPWPIDQPLRVLITVAAPKDAESRYGLPVSNSEKEIETLRTSLRPLLEANLLKLEIVTHAVPAVIRQATIRFRPHVFHLLGHGVVRRNTEYALIEDETYRGRLANVRVLQEFFLDDEETKLTLLCPAEGATEASIQAFLGLARRLNRFGSRAAIAFQRPLPAKSRQKLIWEFYRALAPLNAADVALAEARRRLLMEIAGEEAAWSAPVLFLPSASGQLFCPKVSA